MLCCIDTAVAQTATITASTTSLSFSTAQGTPQPQGVSISSLSGSPVNFTYTTASQSNWLGVFAAPPLTTPASLQVFASNFNLPVGTYTGSVTVTPAAGDPVIINATLNVGTGSSGGGTYSANPTSLSFNAAFGGTAASQSITLSTTGAQTSVGLTANQTWLTVPATLFVGPGAPAAFTVLANPSGLAVGAYTAIISVTPTGSLAAALTIQVTLTVGSSTGTGSFNASPGSLTFTAATPSSAVAPQTLTVTTTSNAYEQVTVTPTSSGNWLTANSSTFATTISPGITQSLPGLVNIGVNPTALTAGTSYSGTITLQSVDFGTITVPVTLNVGTVTGTSNITASPNPVTITIPAGSVTSATAAISVSSTITQNVTAQISSGPSWVSVAPSSQSVTPGVAQNFNVTANPFGQSSGTYTANVLFTPASGTAITVPVNITIGSTSTSPLTPSPTSLSFGYQIGTANPPAQTLSLTSTTAGVPYSFTYTSNGGWLVVTGTNNGSTPANLSVQVNPSNLTAGTYSGNITITANSATQNVPVTLTVGTLPVLQLGSTGVTFNYQYGSTTLPAQQQVTVLSSGNPLTFTAAASQVSGSNFLQITPASGTTPSTLNISLNPAVVTTLQPGTYTGTVTITSASASNATVTLPVTLVVGQSTLLNVSQSSMNFNFEIGQAAPAIQTLAVSSTGSPLSYTVAATGTNCGSNFLTASPVSGSTPGSVAVQVTTTGLVAGTCNGTVTITSAGAANSPLTVPVTLLVSNSALLNVSPAVLNITTQVNTAPANQNIALTSTDPTVALPFNVTSTTSTGGANWLLVGPTSGSTPNNLSVGFQSTSLAIGTYTGSITVTPTTAGVPPTVIPVTLTVTSSATAAVAPASLTFSQALNGTAPASQTLSLTSTTAGLSYAASATTQTGSSNWLTVTPASGTTPGTVTVSANGSGLAQGSYSGVVTFILPGVANTPINVPVTLTVGGASNITATPASVSFTYASGAAAPTAQNVQLASSAGAVPFTVTSTSTPAGLLSVTPASGTTPGTLAIGFVQSVLSTLQAGIYSGTVSVVSDGGSLTIPVSLTVTAAPPPSFITLVNAASNTPGPVSPGEIVTFYGTNLGPVTGVNFTLTGGVVPTSLAGTQVFFDNVAAPLIYVSATQINAIVPYEIAGRVTTNMTIMRGGITSAALQQRVVDTAPAIFSATQTGNGQGAILNANSSPNSSSNAAARGSVIQIYATGEGALNPQALTGSVTGSTAPFPKPAGNVSVTIGGLPATVQFAGEAPTLVSGVLQVNAVIPAGVASGPQTVVLNVGSGTNSQQTITVAVQ